MNNNFEVNKIMKKIFLLLSTLLATFLVSGVLFSCKTIKEIPEEKTAAQIIQMGQNAAAINSFTDAEFCYKEALKKFPEDMNIFVQANYELGHIYTKQKKYEKAEKAFNSILNLADENPYTVPPKYIKLCKMGLERIAIENPIENEDKNHQ